MAYAKKTTPNNEPKAKKVSDKNSPYKKEEEAYAAKMQSALNGNATTNIEFDMPRTDKRPLILEKATALSVAINDAELYAQSLKQKLHSLHDTSEEDEPISVSDLPVPTDIVSQINSFHERIVRVNDSVLGSLKKLNELI